MKVVNKCMNDDGGFPAVSVIVVVVVFFRSLSVFQCFFFLRKKVCSHNNKHIIGIDIE